MAALRAVLAGELWSPQPADGPQTLWLENGRIAAIQPGLASQTGDELDARDGLVVPGLVDIQVNGGLGWSFQANDRSHYPEITRYFLERGTTTLLPTLVTADPATLAASLAELAGTCQNTAYPSLPGIHLEGPFLSPERKGAHDPAALQLPNLALMQAWLASARGKLKIVTLAPELPGALEVIRLLAEAHVLVSAGHSTATYAQLSDAIRAGLRLITHLGNASDWPHRALNELGFLGSEPGVVGSFLARPELSGSLIMDGFHFHPALLKPLVELKGTSRLVLISDASPFTGLPPGEYTSGGLDAVIHPAGFATSQRGGGWLAGSIITLLDAVQRAIHLAGLSLEQALTMATLTPARLIGLDGHKGQILPGADADLLVLNPDLSLHHVIAGGSLIL